jgi:hypothetical protein
MRPRTLLRLFALALLPAGGLVTACGDAGTDPEAGDASDALDGQVVTPGPDGDAGDASDGPVVTPAPEAGCARVTVRDDAGAADADDAGLYPPAYCEGVCPTKYFSCGPGDGGTTCVNCTGRRPEGLREERPDLRGPAAFFAEMARLEAASVTSFAILARELSRLGAPRALVNAARRARRDEMRHARATRALARRHGGTPTAPRIDARPLRDLEAVAMENAVEGCVHETWGALAAHHQAATSTDPVVRAVMMRIARDETMHAALSWRVARWAESRLDAAARRRVQIARDDAVRALVRGAASTPVKLRAVAGLPSAEEARAMLERLDRVLWRVAA